MLDLLFSNPLSFIFFIASLLLAIDVHEFAHAWMADKLGDPTPRLNNRLTLNPLAHLDPLGTLALLITRFGWGKPVPVDGYNLKDPRRDSALISLAGPASNLILAGLLSLIFKTLPLSHLLLSFLQIVIILNVNLAIFNLLPVPPLDGAKILIGLLPFQTASRIEEGLKEYGLILLIFLLFPLAGQAPLASRVISPVIETILNFFL